ncbi:DUF4870 family protein [Mesorhizobium australicum]|uniref:Uncharacterized membrane protein n=1 Tax=Mesorhizobium australicum TaxID=536018 RepID=A0A1X7NQH2_9HYPH|nr:DUF4870 domain-containing protein [Mesorhizobium australicum]SMH39860.1 Uncharacterized membrane protein [Mesorhizobium australicum]
MTDTNPPPAAPRQTDQWLEPGKTNVQIVYFLYIAGMFIPILPLVGLIMAYINRGKAGGWVDTHYTYLIRTFWIGLLYGAIAVILMMLLIGFLLLVAVAVWIIVRCIVGLQAAGRGEPVKNPESWLI